MNILGGLWGGGGHATAVFQQQQYQPDNQHFIYGHQEPQFAQPIESVVQNNFDPFHHSPQPFQTPQPNVELRHQVWPTPQHNQPLFQTGHSHHHEHQRIGAIESARRVMKQAPQFQNAITFPIAVDNTAIWPDHTAKRIISQEEADLLREKERLNTEKNELKEKLDDLREAISAKETEVQKQHDIIEQKIREEGKISESFKLAEQKKTEELTILNKELENEKKHLTDVRNELEIVKNELKTNKSLQTKQTNDFETAFRLHNVKVQREKDVLMQKHEEEKIQDKKKHEELKKMYDKKRLEFASKVGDEFRKTKQLQEMQAKFEQEKKDLLNSHGLFVLEKNRQIDKFKKLRESHKLLHHYQNIDPNDLNRVLTDKNEHNFPIFAAVRRIDHAVDKLKTNIKEDSEMWHDIKKIHNDIVELKKIYTNVHGNTEEKEKQITKLVTEIRDTPRYSEIEQYLANENVKQYYVDNAKYYKPENKKSKKGSGIKRLMGLK